MCSKAIPNVLILFSFPPAVGLLPPQASGGCFPETSHFPPRVCKARSVSAPRWYKVRSQKSGVRRRKMLDLAFVRDNLERVEEKLAQRGLPGKLDAFREVDQKRRRMLTEV